jgi:peptide/nickel transport system ATP-binding protein
MPLLSVNGLTTSFLSAGHRFTAVDRVSFHINQGETVGLVGESGCGKSTLGKTILRLIPSTAGSIEIEKQDIVQLRGRALAPYRRRMQMVFQDPLGSLNPRQTIRRLLDTPLVVHGLGDRAQRHRTILDMMDRVGLPAASLEKYPHEFSGGQRQRIGIARALILSPQLIICDEPVSALDLSIQAQILNLLVDLKQELDLSYLFISHDLSVIRYFVDRVLVMYKGRIVESAGYRQLWDNPAHPYTRTLLSAVPVVDKVPRPGPHSVQEDISPPDIGGGCLFRGRCPLAISRCESEEPQLRPVDDTHAVACHRA